MTSSLKIKAPEDTLDEKLYKIRNISLEIMQKKTKTSHARERKTVSIDSKLEKLKSFFEKNSKFLELRQINTRVSSDISIESSSQQRSWSGSISFQFNSYTVEAEFEDINTFLKKIQHIVDSELNQEVEVAAAIRALSNDPLQRKLRVYVLYVNNKNRICGAHRIVNSVEEDDVLIEVEK